jgi:hypothetical protein
MTSDGERMHVPTPSMRTSKPRSRQYAFSCAAPPLSARWSRRGGEGGREGRRGAGPRRASSWWRHRPRPRGRPRRPSDPCRARPAPSTVAQAPRAASPGLPGGRKPPILLFSDLPAHSKAPYKTDLRWRTLRVLKHPKRARTVRPDLQHVAAQPLRPPRGAQRARGDRHGGCASDRVQRGGCGAARGQTRVSTGRTRVIRDFRAPGAAERSGPPPRRGRTSSSKISMLVSAAAQATGCPLYVKPVCAHAVRRSAGERPPGGGVEGP